jgi:hypothetical protein
MEHAMTPNAEEITMTYRQAVEAMIREFPGRMFTYNDPRVTGATDALWGDGLMADTRDREEAGAIPGEYAVHDGAIWWVREEGEHTVPMVQAIL